MARTVNGIEIPEDLDGIDDDIALGLMKDHGLIDDQHNEPEKTEVTTDKVESTDGEDAEKKPEVKEVATPTTGEAAPVKEQEEQGEKTTEKPEGVDTNGKTVPYQAMIAERNKRKALQAELDQLRAAQQTNPSQVQAPTSQTTPTEQSEEEKAEQQEKYEQYLDNAAREMFQEKFGREPDELNPKDTVALARYSIQVETEIIKLKEQQKQSDEAQNQVAQSFFSFVEDAKARDDFDDLQVMFDQEYKALPDDEKPIIAQAYQRCETGKGTPQDIYLIKKLWNETVTKSTKSTQQPEVKEPQKVVIPPKQAKTAEEKLEQIEKHPKSTLVTGNNASASTSMDEIARLMSVMPWEEFEKKYPEYAELVLEG